MKPLLAGKVDLAKLKYPVLVSPKLDGIRCLAVDGVAMSRKMKPIPNKYVQSYFQQLKLHGLDGELMVQGDFNSVQSAIMSRDGEPDFTYNVFDMWTLANTPFQNRLGAVVNARLKEPMRIRIVGHNFVENEDDLLSYLDAHIDQGYEGAMIRDPHGLYKFGRSTVREGILLKLKKFFDDEGTLVRFEEKMRNGNELVKDELGYAKRSSAKENLTPAGTCGAAVVQWNGMEFKVGFGPGIDDSSKQSWWDNREALTGSPVTFRYQELSKDGIPRFGKLIGFRID